MKNNTKNPSLAQIAIQTMVLKKHLEKANIGDRIPYDELEKVAGCDVRAGNRGYRYLFRARRLLERDAIFFAAVRKTDDGFHGIQRLTNEEAVKGSVRGRRNISHRARLEANRLLVNKGYDQFDDETKNLWNVNVTWFRVVDHWSRPSLIKQIETKCAANGEPLKIGDTLGMFE